MCVWGGMLWEARVAHSCMWRSKDSKKRVGFCMPPCGSQSSKSGHWVWWQAPLPADLSLDQVTIAGDVSQG